MDRNAILAKTPLALDEIKNRANGLPQKLRSLLIMIDGKSSTDVLAARFAALPDIEALLQALIAQGYVEVKPLQSTTPPASGTRRAPSHPDRMEGMRVLTRLLIDALGPDADLVTGRLERAHTHAEFTAVSERCIRMLVGAGARKKAQDFREHCEAYAALHLAAA